MDHTIKSGKKSNSNSTNVKIIYLFLLILGIALGYFLRQTADTPVATQQSDQIHSYKHAIHNAKEAAALPGK